MRDDQSGSRRRDIVAILTLLSLFLFASPFTNWWAQAAFPWYFPFVLWGLLIALVVVTQLLGRSFED